MKKDWKQFDITDNFQDMMSTPKGKSFKKIVIIELVVIFTMIILSALTK